MTKCLRRTIAIFIGIILSVGSVVWMIHSSQGISPLPAILFSAGMVLVLDTIKRTLLDFERR